MIKKNRAHIYSLKKHIPCKHAKNLRSIFCLSASIIHRLLLNPSAVFRSDVRSRVARRANTPPLYIARQTFFRDFRLSQRVCLVFPVYIRSSKWKCMAGHTYTHTYVYSALQYLGGWSEATVTDARLRRRQPRAPRRHVSLSTCRRTFAYTHTVF